MVCFYPCFHSQVVSGPDPVTIRAKLKAALPRAPQKQLVSTKLMSFVTLSKYDVHESRVRYKFIMQTSIVLSYKHCESRK